MRSSVGRRTKSIIIGTATSIIPRGLGFVYTIAIIPLVVNLLGGEALGVWLTVVSIVEVLSFADLGITNNIINKISKASLDKDASEERKIVSSSFFIILAIAALVLVLYFVFKEYVDWGKLLSIQDKKLQKEAIMSLDIMIGYFVINFPLVIYQKIRYAIHERHILNFYESVGKILSITLVIGGVYLKFNLPELIFAFILGQVIGQLLNTFTLIISKTKYIPKINYISQASTKDIFSTSLFFFTINVCYIFYTSLDNFLISHLLNPNEVAKFASIKRVYLIFPMLMALVTPSLWVANREAFIKKDFPWLKKVYKKGLMVMFYSFVLLIIISFALNADFFLWFTNGKINFEQTLVIAIALNAVTMISYNIFSSFFIAIDEIKTFTFLFLFFSIASFFIKYLLLQELGLAYTYVINASAYVVFFFLPCIYYLEKVIKKIC